MFKNLTLFLKKLNLMGKAGKKYALDEITMHSRSYNC